MITGSKEFVWNCETNVRYFQYVVHRFQPTNWKLETACFTREQSVSGWILWSVDVVHNACLQVISFKFVTPP